ncbi:MAG: hypothetical protein D6706_14100 [Chloroflexi bacterium]|nr:MAG: hypothetical protein D6706_14100 [Chloroflexota bacterium]
MKSFHFHRTKRLLFLLAFVFLSFLLMIALWGTVLPQGAVQAAPLQQTGPTIQFSSASYSRSENGGSATITVDINGTLTGTASVEYLTVDGTATSGSDYTAASGVLTFTTSPSSLTFSVTIINDSTDEPDETVNLVLRNPVNAVLGSDDTAVLTILDDDPTPATPTPTSSAATPIFVDVYEPNNDFSQAYTISVGGGQLCNATLWPFGDEDFFRFSGKAGSTYQITTSNLSAGLDTVLTIYNTTFNQIASNDDAGIGNLASDVTVSVNVDGFYYARVENKDPSDPAGKTYCIEVKEVNPPTPTPSNTPVPGADECEFNSTLETACVIGVGETKSLSFVPVFGSPQDTDVFRLWVKPGIQYTCETTNLSPVADTNIILLDHNGNDFNPPIGNDDKAPGDLGSKVTYLSTYTGWLYIMVGPVNPPPYEESFLHTYDLTCTATAATPTPTPTATFRPGTGGGVPAATPTPFPTFPPTPTPIDLSLFATPTPAPPPVIQFQPLPTATPLAGGQIPATINVTLYYDSNGNFTPELTEGIMDVAVSVFDNTTGELLAFGFTNEAGVIRFDSIVSSGAIRVVVPFLGYSQLVVGNSANILLRVAPQPLPLEIP